MKLKEKVKKLASVLRRPKKSFSMKSLTKVVPGESSSKKSSSFEKKAAKLKTFKRPTSARATVPMV